MPSWGPGLGRLTRKQDFERVYREGRAGASRYVIVRVCRREGPAVRVGFAVGRRAGGAVERNRIRRRLREALRAELSRVPEGLDLVISPRAGCGAASFDSLRASLRSALAVAGAGGVPPEDDHRARMSKQ